MMPVSWPEVYMIDGLKLMFSGKELQTLLAHAIERHDERASRWKDATLQQDDDPEGPQLPLHICENEIERHVWRAEVLAFIRDHVDPGDTYRLGAADLEYGELLPEKPAWLQQEAYEERTRLGFQLERLVKSVEGVMGLAAVLQRDVVAAGDTREAAGEPCARETDGYRPTRVDAEDGGEMIKIERT
jgi:hypothetical protein